MLETNHFSEGQFQSIVSSFTPKKTYRVKQTTFGEPPSLNSTLSKFSPKLIALGEAQTVYSSSKRKGSNDDKITYNAILAKTGFLKPTGPTKVL